MRSTTSTMKQMGPMPPTADANTANSLSDCNPAHDARDGTGMARAVQSEQADGIKEIHHLNLASTERRQMLKMPR
jgi:hypothetical protein